MRNIRDCNVCVVGGAGFLGSHLVKHLVEDRGCEVQVIDNLYSGRREFIHPKAYFAHHDITYSEEFLRKLFKGMGIKFVMNYAAHPYVPDSFARPIEVANVNFFGAMKVVNAAHEAGCEAVLQVSSAEVYGDGYPTAVQMLDPQSGGHFVGKCNEQATVKPHSTYGASKAAIDSYCQVAWKERRVPVIALRQFNCVGERETHPYVVPEIISQLSRQVTWRLAEKGGNLNHEGIGYVKLGNNSFRDFMYAGDAVRVAVELLERGEFGEVYNLGSESGVKIYDLAKLIGEAMGFRDVRVEEDANRKRPWEIWHLQSDNTKLIQTLGWEARVVDLSRGQRRFITPLKDAIRKTIDYYKGNGCKWVWEK